MPNNRKNILEKKVVFNLSIRRVVKEQFELKCEEMMIDKNAVAESLFSEYLRELKQAEHDPTK